MSKKIIKKKDKGPLSVKEKQHIMKELKNLILNGKIQHSRYEDIANDFNTTRQTISNYVNDIYASIPPEDINKVLIDFRLIFDKLEKEIDVILSKAMTAKQKIEAINTYFRLMREKTDMLERFFLKAKAVDRQEVTSVNLNIDVNKLSDAILEDI